MVHLLAGCVGTTYARLDAERPPVPMLERQVNYHLSAAYLRHPPGCVAIWNPSAGVPPALGRAVARTTEQHLTTRIRRTISAVATRRHEQRLGLDLDNPVDRRTFAQRVGCGTLLQIILGAVTDDYLVVWTQKGFRLTLRLLRPGTGETQLWAATHDAERGDGGLPLSLLSLPLTAFRALRLNADPETFDSIADDAVRRMFATLPDVRQAWP